MRIDFKRFRRIDTPGAWFGQYYTSVNGRQFTFGPIAFPYEMSEQEAREKADPAAVRALSKCATEAHA